jgi:hypothetical protein
LILSLARGKYQGCNDSHLTEKLRLEENLAVSRETVHRLLRPRKWRLRRSAGLVNTALGAHPDRHAK